MSATPTAPAEQYAGLCKGHTRKRNPEGRWAEDYLECRNVTRDPSGYCRAHRGQAAPAVAGRMRRSVTFTLDRPNGVYYGETDGRRYEIRREGRRRWVLRVRKLAETAGVTHALGQPVVDATDCTTRQECMAVAEAYSDLGNYYRPKDNKELSRMAAAIIEGYNYLKVGMKF